jgi:hypothetical protein
VIALPLGVLAVWFALAGLFQAWRLYRRQTAGRVRDRSNTSELPDARDHHHA